MDKTVAQSQTVITQELLPLPAQELLWVVCVVTVLHQFQIAITQELLLLAQVLI